MATAPKKAPARKAPARKAAAKKAPAKKTAARKAAPKKAEFDLKASAEKVVNIYLGVLGKGFDRVQENVESARKDSDKRMKDLEKRGAKLRKDLEKRMDDIEVPEFEGFDNVVEDVKEQFSKLQDQVEDAVENVKEKLTPAKAA